MSGPATRSPLPLGWEHVNLTGDYIWSAERPVTESRDRFVRSGLRPIPLARPPEFVVCPLMREIRAFRYFWPTTAQGFRAIPRRALKARKLAQHDVDRQPEIAAAKAVDLQKQQEAAARKQQLLAELERDAWCAMPPATEGNVYPLSRPGAAHGAGAACA